MPLIRSVEHPPINIADLAINTTVQSEFRVADHLSSRDWQKITDIYEQLSVKFYPQIFTELASIFLIDPNQAKLILEKRGEEIEAQAVKYLSKEIIGNAHLLQLRGRAAILILFPELRSVWLTNKQAVEKVEKYKVLSSLYERADDVCHGLAFQKILTLQQTSPSSPFLAFKPTRYDNLLESHSLFTALEDSAWSRIAFDDQKPAMNVEEWEKVAELALQRFSTDWTKHGKETTCSDLLTSMASISILNADEARLNERGLQLVNFTRPDNEGLSQQPPPRKKF